jgi:hypothetical protein
MSDNEKKSKANKSYYERNKEHCKQKAKEYQALHSEAYRLYYQEYYQNNKEALKEKHRLWRQRTGYKKKKKYPRKPTGNPRGRPRNPVVSAPQPQPAPGPDTSLAPPICDVEPEPKPLPMIFIEVSDSGKGFSVSFS